MVPILGIVAVEVKVPEIPAIVNWVIVNALLACSGSESFNNKLSVIIASSSIFSVSGATTGGSFTGVTVMLKVPEVTPPLPSETA